MVELVDVDAAEAGRHHHIPIEESVGMNIDGDGW